MKRIDGYLSGKAQAGELSALVYCEELDDGTGTYERWTLEAEGESIGLGDNFRDARQAVNAWARSRRARERAENDFEGHLGMSPDGWSEE